MKIRLIIFFTVAWLIGAALGHVVGVWPAMASTAIVLGSCVLWLAKDPDIGDGLLPPDAFTARALLIGLVAGIVQTVLTYTLFGPSVHFYAALDPQTHLLYKLFGAATIGKGILLVPVIIGEELVWRGFVLSRLRTRFNRPLAILLTALAYGLAHSPFASPAFILVAVLCGLFWGIVAAYAPGIAAAIIAHAIWDYSVMMIHPLLR